MGKNVDFFRTSRDWVEIEFNCISVWLKGYLIGTSHHDLAREFYDTISNCDTSVNIDLLSHIVLNTFGHFSIVVQYKNILFSAVDRVRSIPLYYKTKDSNRVVALSDHPRSFLSDNDLLNKDKDAVTEISMSGYTIGEKTLYKDIFQLNSGECLLVDGDKYNNKFYYNFSPWLATNRLDKKKLSKFLLKTTIDVMRDTIDSCNNRQIVVPLSAGKDSRLIVSALHILNYKNVKCFSYGKKNSSDMAIGRKIAKRLNYEWFGVLSTKKKHQKIFNSDKFKSYKEKFETLSSAPFYQDFYAVSELKKIGWIDEDAVFINGNTGDFLSGGHITKKLLKGSEQDLYNEFLKKHYSQWKFLRCIKNDNLIIDSLKSLLIERFVSFRHKIPVYSLYEFYEWTGRQSKHITLMQQCYDFFGHEWRMPLWDNRLMDFWERVPVELKYKQKLYKDVFVKENWGNVWHDIDINPKEYNKPLVMLLRLTFKFLFLFLGKDRWHSFDNRFFKYFTSPTDDYFMLSYSQYIFDARGAKDARSWRIEMYLNSHNICLDAVD